MLAFFIRCIESPIPNFNVYQSSDVQIALASLKEVLDDPTCSGDIGEAIHRTLWALLSVTSREMHSAEIQNPFNLFLLAASFNSTTSCFIPVRQIPPNIAKLQWILRATGLKELHAQTGNDPASRDQVYTKEIRPHLVKTGPYPFAHLRQMMSAFSTIVYQSPGINLFLWNTDKTVVSLDGYPICVDDLCNSVSSGISYAHELIRELCGDVDLQPIFSHIDQCLDPSTVNKQRWFFDRPTFDKVGCSFINEGCNELMQYNQQLIAHMAKKPQFFLREDDKLYPNQCTS